MRLRGLALAGLAALSLTACMAGDVGDMDGDDAPLPDAGAAQRLEYWKRLRAPG